jgi:hypothetical protein
MYKRKYLITNGAVVETIILSHIKYYIKVKPNKVNTRYMESGGQKEGKKNATLEQLLRVYNIVLCGVKTVKYESSISKPKTMRDWRQYFTMYVKEKNSIKRITEWYIIIWYVCR